MNGKPARYAIVGMKHRGAEEFVKSLPPDEPLVLVREPDNKFDANAVQVWARGRHIGYIPKTQNAVLSQYITACGKPWLKPSAVLAIDAVMPTTAEVFKSVGARLHLGSNTYPLVEVV